MSLNTKVNGSWEEAEDLFANVNGQWKIAKSAWANIGGTWEQTHAVQVLDRFYRSLTGAGFNSTVYSVAVQSDGKILVCGAFSQLNGETRNRLVRLNSNGTEDTAFYTNLGTGFSSTVQSVVVQSDGKILVGGAFTTLNGATRSRLVRLNADGTEDTAFYTNLGTSFNNVVWSIAVQSDGKIVLSGQFTTLNGATRNRLVRLNSNGTDDTAFNTNLGTGFDNTIYSGSVAVQSDGKILVAGRYITFNNATREKLVRLNSDGTEDTAFYANLGTGFNSTVWSLALQSDGKIVLGGQFTSVNGVTRNRLVRLNPNGTEDTAFGTNLGTGFNSTIYKVAVQSDGKILVVGAFTQLSGVTRNRLVRLNADGTEDTAFYTNLGTGFTDEVWAIEVQSDGKILVGGSFRGLNGATRNYLVRLNADGTDSALATTNYVGLNATVYSVAVQSDGKIVVGGEFTTLTGLLRNRLVRLNADGTEDTDFNTNLGDGFNSTLYALAVQSDGKILVGGQFQFLNGATRARLVRLNADGTDDTAFYTNMGTAFNSTVYSIVVQPDGKILVGGTFATLNGLLRTRLVRLNTDGTEDTDFYTNLGTGFNSTIRTLAVQSDGKILVGGLFSSLNGVTRNRLVRLNPNGTEDTAFYTNMGTGFGNGIYALAVQSDGKIFVGGQFLTLNGVGRFYFVVLSSTGIDETPPAFYEGYGFYGIIYATAVQSDGKMLVGGSLTQLNGVTRNRLVRLNTDGTEDTAFYANLGTGFDNIVWTLAVQSDGKILVGGQFTTLNGASRRRLVRLNSDGTEDTAFYTNMGTAFSSVVRSLVVQSDGKIVVGGDFSAFNNISRNRITRLNSNGTEDTAFYPNLGTGFTGAVYALAVQSDGKILVAGSFSFLNGVSRGSLVRLNSNGAEDTAFYANMGTGFNGWVVSVAVQSDGKILAGGTYSFLNGAARNELVRLNSNGTEDTAFYANMGTGFNNAVRSLAVQSDGKIVAGGAFSSLNGATKNRLVRINTDGTEDTAFYANMGTGFDNIVWTLAVQSDGKMFVGGQFTGLNGATRRGIAKLNSDGTDAVLSTTSYFGFNSLIYALAVQSDGKILVGGQFTQLNGVSRKNLLRLNTNLTDDTDFYTDLGAGLNNTVYSVAVRSDGKMALGGAFVYYKDQFFAPYLAVLKPL
jgi:uncharacterized delta-60 repeat protein